MDSSQTFLSGGRYELLETQGGIEVLDHEPWRRCWSCGSTDNESGESYCLNCGAVLEKRVYSGVLNDAGQSDGLSLITTIDDVFVRSVLPKIWDVLEEDGRKLVLIDNNGYSPALPPMDELDALHVGLDMARVLVVLHRAGLALNKLTSGDVGITASGQTHLFNAPGLRRMSSDTQRDTLNNDLQDLAGLLEELTATPRTTQRLQEQEDETSLDDVHELTATDPLSLTGILRQIRVGIVEDATHLENLLDALLVDLTSPLHLHQNAAASSDTGMVRDHNEDSLLTLNLVVNNVSADRAWGLYVVADGMGGHAAGEVASGLAVRSVADVMMREYLTYALDPDTGYNQKRVDDVVRQAVLYANEAVRNEARVFRNDMGTTLTMALVIGDRATIANVGDSRTFLFRDGKLRRISRDHSLVMRLVELGQISEDDIYTHPQRNAVLRSLGDQGEVEIDIFQERLKPNDALLLCSDGQWEMTRNPEIERILTRYEEPEQACHELIKAANRAGGEDNITSIVVRLT